MKLFLIASFVLSLGCSQTDFSSGGKLAPKTESSDSRNASPQNSTADISLGGESADNSAELPISNTVGGDLDSTQIANNSIAVDDGSITGSATKCDAGGQLLNGYCYYAGDNKTCNNICLGHSGFNAKGDLLVTSQDPGAVNCFKIISGLGLGNHQTGKAPNGSSPALPGCYVITPPHGYRGWWHQFVPTNPARGGTTAGASKKSICACNS